MKFVKSELFRKMNNEKDKLLFTINKYMYKNINCTGYSYKQIILSGDCYDYKTINECCRMISFDNNYTFNSCSMRQRLECVHGHNTVIYSNEADNFGYLLLAIVCVIICIACSYSFYRRYKLNKNEINEKTYLYVD